MIDDKRLAGIEHRIERRLKTAHLDDPRGFSAHALRDIPDLIAEIRRLRELANVPESSGSVRGHFAMGMRPSERASLIASLIRLYCVHCGEYRDDDGMCECMTETNP